MPSTKDQIILPHRSCLGSGYLTSIKDLQQFCLESGYVYSLPRIKILVDHLFWLGLWICALWQGSSCSSAFILWIQCTCAFYQGSNCRSSVFLSVIRVSIPSTNGKIAFFCVTTYDLVYICAIPGMKLSLLSRNDKYQVSVSCT